MGSVETVPQMGIMWYPTNSIKSIFPLTLQFNLKKYVPYPATWIIFLKAIHKNEQGGNDEGRPSTEERARMTSKA